jgi:hypothetical protein
MKVIFDRSAFHGCRFDALEGSCLLQRTREGKLSVFYTTVFLDETVRTALSTRQSAKDALKRQWPFLVSICNGGWFKPLLPDKSFPDLKTVCEEEFEGGEKPGDWLLVPNLVRRNVEGKLTRCFEESRPIPELENARPIYGQIGRLKEQNRTLLVDLRNQPRPDEPFEDYYQLVADECASRLIGELPALDQPKRKLDAWRRDPEKFPHFTAYVRLYAFVHYDPHRHKNSSIDWNCLEDAEQLCFLEDVDAMISSEQGFMKRAFEAVWKSRGKRLFTPEALVGLVGS